MDAMKEIFNLNITSLIMGVFIIMAGIIAAIDIIGKFSKIIGKPVKWIREREEIQKLTLENAKAIQELAKKHEEDTQKSIKHDEIIRNDLQKLTTMFIEKQIDDMRFEILDFASALSSGRQYNRESFDHILKIYRKYESILEDNGMENGLVKESIKFIHEQYHIALQKGTIS